MQKLIKLSNKHYVVINDKEIQYNINGTVGNFLCLDEIEYGFKDAYVELVGNCNSCREILFSTIPIKGVKKILLSDIKRVIKNNNFNETEWFVDIVDNKIKLIK